MELLCLNKVMYRIVSYLYKAWKGGRGGGGGIKTMFRNKPHNKTYFYHCKNIFKAYNQDFTIFYLSTTELLKRFRGYLNCGWIFRVFSIRFFFFFCYSHTRYRHLFIVISVVEVISFFSLSLTMLVS